MNDLGLERFVQAAHQGPLVWVQETDGQPAVQSGNHPYPGARPDVGALLAAALREHFGLAASVVAEKELALDERPRRSLPARTVLRAAACAESALALLMAEATVLRFEFSAEYLGRRFVHLCWELSIEPRSLSLERRQALDQALSPVFAGRQPTSVAAAREQLRALLTLGLH